jgi:hypothetical protein
MSGEVSRGREMNDVCDRNSSFNHKSPALLLRIQPNDAMTRALWVGAANYDFGRKAQDSAIW